MFNVFVFRRKTTPQRRRDVVEDNIYSEPPASSRGRDPPLEMLASNRLANGRVEGNLPGTAINRAYYSGENDASQPNDPEVSPYSTDTSPNDVTHTSSGHVPELYAAVKKEPKESSLSQSQADLERTSDPETGQLYAAVRKTPKHSAPVPDQDTVERMTDVDVSQLYAEVKKNRRDSAEMDIQDNSNYASFDG